MRGVSGIARRRALARAGGDSDYRQRRSEVNEAAITVFRRMGYRATSLQDIANELGVDRASLYYYVSGKEELYRDLVMEAVHENVCEVERLRGQAGPADVRIAELIKGLMASFERHYPYLFLFVQEDLSHVDRDTDWGRNIVSLTARFDESIRLLVQQGINDGTLDARGGDARLLANAIIGMCNWSYRWFHPQLGASNERIGSVFAAVVLQGISKPR